MRLKSGQVGGNLIYKYKSSNLLLAASEWIEFIEKQVFQVQKRIVRGGIARQQRYNLYFIDEKLVKYEKDSEKFSF